MESTNHVKSKSSVPFWCSIRVAITFIAFLGMVIHYSQRLNISIGLICMVNHSAIEHHSINSKKPYIITKDDCPLTNNTNRIEGPFIWPKDIQGIILGGFFWGYIISQIPAGYLASRYGARFIFGGSILVSSIATMFMPFSANIHWITLYFLQVIVGFAHGAIWPCVSVVIAHWTPINERGKLMGFITAGCSMGSVLILSSGGLMCSWKFAGGWPLIFYSTSISGLIWSIIWILFYTNSPRNHQCISAQEKEYILQHTQQHLSNNKKRDFNAPWKAIFTSRACWALFIINICGNYGSYTFQTSIPKYMNEVLKFDIKSNGFLSSLPFIVLWLSINFSGFLADIFIRKKIFTITQTRKIFNILGSVIPAIFIIGVAFMTCQQKYIAVVLLTLGIASNGFCFGGGYHLVPNDMAPAYAGIIFGISNTISTIPGFVSPYIVGTLTEHDSSNWRIVFFICAIIYIIGMIVFTIFGSSELQPWAIKHIKNIDVNDNLLSKESGEISLKMTNVA